MKTNYIIIGDSITYGIGDFESGGWSTMFKNYIVNQDDSKVCNNYVSIAGFPGATSLDILNKIDIILQVFKHKEFKNTVILSIGINDTQIFDGKSKINIQDYKSNMDKIAKIVIDNGCNLIILGLTRIQSDEKFLWKPSKYYDNSIISQYDKILMNDLQSTPNLKQLFFNKKIQYISLKDVLQKLDFADGLHPNHKGHKKILDHIIKYVK